MPAHFAQPENLKRNELEAFQLERLQILLKTVNETNCFWKKKFRNASVKVAEVHSLDDLQHLPLLIKKELVEDQEANPPYGSNLTFPLVEYARMHQTSGTTTGQPMRWLDTTASWKWFKDCWAQIFRIVGLVPEDILAFPFSFGPFIGFWAGFEGANQLGNLCLAGGGMSSQARLKLIDDNRATFLCCTPTYALRLAEVARDENTELKNNSVRALLVAGEPGGSVASVRKKMEKEWGARVFDHWGMTEVGSLAVECVEHPGGLHMLESECLCEVIHLQTQLPVEPGEVGELVITNLGRAGSPLIRYRTGDLVKVDTSRCPCGREIVRFDGGILGRTDEMMTIRGNNVFPSSLEGFLREFEQVAEFRITLFTERSMQQLKFEIEPLETVNANSLRDSIAREMKDRFNFTAEVEMTELGTLPRFESKGQRFFREI